MSNTIRRESPLVGVAQQRQTAAAPGNRGLMAWEQPFCGHINLRGDPASPDFLAAVRSVLGCPLPLEPNTVAGSGNRTVLWLGPNEWLIVVPDGSASAIIGPLQRALDGQFFAVTEVSGGQTIVAIRGNHVRDLLAKGCPLDFHPRAFGPGRCAQSHLAKAPILLYQLDHEPTFALIMRRSFADYLWHWLRDAADEYGFAVVAQPPAARQAAASTAEPLLAANG